MADLVRPQLTAGDVVMTGRHAALEPWWHRYDEADRRRAESLLSQVGVGGLGGQAFGTLSSGERQRVLLARTLMNEPDLVLLDEPMAALDLGGREELVATLSTLSEDPTAPALVLVTHHLEEVPPGITHALLLDEGRVQVAGPIASVLTDVSLSRCFGLAVHLARRGDRYTAVAGPVQVGAAGPPGTGATRASRVGRERAISSPSIRSSSEPPKDPP
jgi:iron complex transport system ATP-binding protein